MGFKEFLATYKKVWKTSTAENPNKEFEMYCQPITICTDKILSDSAMYAIWWFVENKFFGSLVRNNTSKTKWVVTRDGVTDNFTLTATLQSPKKCNIEAYMKEFNKSFEMKCEIERLRSMKNK